MTEEIREIIDSAKARGLYEQMLDAAKEYVEVPKEERRKRCYLISGKQHDILEGVIELEGLKPVTMGSGDFVTVTKSPDPIVTETLD